MDPLTIIIACAALVGFIGLAFIGGWELGLAEGAGRERDLANRRINGLLAHENTRKPKAAKNRRKAQRKAVRA